MWEWPSLSKSSKFEFRILSMIRIRTFETIFSARLELWVKAYLLLSTNASKDNPNKQT
jgi:hypothetical protein